MPATPLISVIMPVRNLRKYIRSAMDSILTQTLGDFELILVDDRSTDGTSQIIAEYAARDSRIRIVPGTASGLGKALNLGVSQARAPLIARMDGDDISLPTRFE